MIPFSEVLAPKEDLWGQFYGCFYACAMKYIISDVKLYLADGFRNEIWPRPLADHGIIETLNLKIFVVKCFGGNKETHSTFSLGIYREVQQDFTPEIEVFHMLFERFHTKNIKRSLKQHIKYFNFRSKAELDHPVLSCFPSFSLANLPIYQYHAGFHLSPDSDRLPRGAARRRVAAPAQGDPQPAHLRDGLRGMPQAPLPHHQDQLLRAQRVPHPQGRRTPEHLLPLQRIHGGPAGRHGRRYPRWVSSWYDAPLLEVLWFHISLDPNPYGKSPKAENPTLDPDPEPDS